jgi:hypothetical protein
MDCGRDEAKSQRRTTTKRGEGKKEGRDAVAAGHQQFLDEVLYQLNLNREENTTIMEM